MKKLLILALLLGTVAASARSTIWNIRVGGGLQSNYKTYGVGYGDRIIGPAPGVEFLLQPNIALGEKKKWVFAPSLQVGIACEAEYATQFSMPLLFGYRIKMGNRSMFVPKVGPYVGYCIKPGNVVAGPMLDLAFEFGRFVMGIDAYYSFLSGNAEYYYYSFRWIGSFRTDGSMIEAKSKYNPYGINISFGVKF